MNADISIVRKNPACSSAAGRPRAILWSMYTTVTASAPRKLISAAFIFSAILYSPQETI